jgi:hypothetical protein
MSVLKPTFAASLVLACTLAVAGTAAAARIGATASYTWTNSGVGWVCVKVSGPANAAVKVTVKGGSVVGVRTKSTRIGAKRVVIVKFKTNYPAGYDFYAKSGTTTRHVLTNLPQPGTDRKTGPFSCA